MTPLVLVHGFMGGSAQWELQRRHLEQHVDVVALDLPGFGDNNHLHAPDRIEDYARYVLDTVSDQGIEEFDLLGHSMGGMVVQEVVAIAPHRVRKLVLYGSGASSQMTGRFESFEQSKRRAQADGATATAARIAATWFLGHERAEHYESCAAIAKKATLQAMVAGIDAFSSWSRVDNLPNISCPTLIVWGEHDRSYAWGQIEQLWRLIPNASLAVVPGCAHAVHMEKPDLFNLLLLDHLRS